MVGALIRAAWTAACNFIIAGSAHAVGACHADAHRLPAAAGNPGKPVRLPVLKVRLGWGHMADMLGRVCVALILTWLAPAHCQNPCRRAAEERQAVSVSCLPQRQSSKTAARSAAEAALDNHMAACRKQLTAAPSSAIYTSQSGKHVHTLGRFYASQSPVLVSNKLGCRCWQRALPVSGVPPAGGLAASHRRGASGGAPAHGVSGCRATHTGAQRRKANRGGVAGEERGLKVSKGRECMANGNAQPS